MIDKGAVRQANLHLAKENAKWPKALKVWPQEEWPAHITMRDCPSRVMRSNKFLVLFYPAEYPAACRLSVARTMVGANGRWTENITWDELQQLKAEAGLGDRLAVEIFPPEYDVVNVANMRHLWIMAYDLPFVWRTKI